MTTATDEAAEAICGALHYSDFQHTGEQRVRGHGIALPQLWSYFVIGEHPEDVRVTVKRDEPFVVVSVEWRIFDGGRVRQMLTPYDMRIDCSADRARQQIEESTQAVVQRCLEIYRDVLQHTGYASVGYLAAHKRPKA